MAAEESTRDDGVLGRVADPAALSEERRGLARFETSAPRAWSGSRVRATLPRSLPCMTCSGGGCDGCDRRGAFRLPDDPAARAVELTVPPFPEPVVGVRVPRPFGDDSPIRQIFVVFDERDAPDPRLERLDVALVVDAAAVAPPLPSGWIWAGVAAALAVLAAIARLLAG